MMSKFIEQKLKMAKYKLLKNGTFFAEIPSIRGVWANAKTLEKCREELAEVLEEWMFLHIREKKNIPGFSTRVNFKMPIRERAYA
ncbi:antitoxin HicB [Candidatus Nomurabacteria bacterium RIFCSPHIGHO2_02_FULL_37_13]|uniref:Antitoxin HicB n=1 Tax=Candidatus Nomurabacteria bacterium RIFCSPHIGHO2_02_FULL_37_13 TaxID=1801750 RepID=A0A1F6W5J1_9BACT|nr:MAG: antitoxin HicB [Candidatus Nomurabacteria bacterium RIFCSPHIGHO2_01_FULL_36_23]OGI77198.1 MAG: antitoxin HicB [Candidatus Nomurabacteria bacterium RIFCSPHIGHO2_02_FULL_37_13]OGI87738.1 MAG: antitoxin HicB [Candidatus Nomurabacteria bacterium RIFCSPLOWO2_01_FULL_37_25]